MSAFEYMKLDIGFLSQLIKCLSGHRRIFVTSNQQNRNLHLIQKSG